MPVDPILSAIDARIAALQQLRGHVVEVLGLLGPLPGPETLPAPRETNGPSRASKRAARASNPPKGETVRPTDALSEVAIRTALKQGPLKFRVLEAETQLPKWKLLRVLRALVASGEVEISGATSSRRYALA